MKYKIIYFTGTGGTKLAAEKLAHFLTEVGVSVDVKNISDESIKSIDEDTLIVMFPVHAWGAPIPIYETIDNLSKSTGKNAAVISISAGGDAVSNLGCRIKAKRKLRKRKYHIIYEDMVMMPCNWVKKDPDEIASLMINFLDSKMKYISQILLDGGSRKLPSVHKNIPIRSRIFAALGTFSRRVGFPMMGKFYKADDKCTSCGLCAKVCPNNNIKMKKGKPAFGWRCLVCMKCIYICPVRAISAGPFDFMIVDGGYDLEQMKKNAKNDIESKKMIDGSKKINDESIKKYINSGIR